MAVQLLEDWLLKEQGKILQNYRDLNQAPLKDPGVIFIGDSIVEYFPIQELLTSRYQMVNRGVRGYKTDLLRDNLDAHVFGTAPDQVFFLIGTNDIGKGITTKETITNLEEVVQRVSRDYPLTQIKLVSVLPVNESAAYRDKVYIRTNQQIQELNQAYLEMSQAYHQLDFVPAYEALLDGRGQLNEDYTTDGLHLTIAGYRALAKVLQAYMT